MNNASEPRTVLITGASSGIGRATAQLFLARGWNVVATMRDPARDQALAPAPNLVKLRLDVLDQASIDAVRDAVEGRFGRLDALVNNAGYGLVGTFESMPMQRIETQFGTNVFGLMRVTQAFLPLLRARRGATIVNLSSAGGRTTIPLYSAYHATKFAVEGFSDSLQYELARFGIRVALIEPGAVKTDFVGRSADVAATSLAAYTDYEAGTLALLTAEGNKGIAPAVVARAIYDAATAKRPPLRYVVGLQAKALLGIQKLMPARLYRSLVTSMFSATTRRR